MMAGANLFSYRTINGSYISYIILQQLVTLTNIVVT